MQPTETDAPLILELRRAWRDGERPRLIDFVARRPPLPVGMLFQLARVDQEERWRAGVPIAVYHYFEWFAPLRGYAKAAQLVTQDRARRQQLGLWRAEDEDGIRAEFPQFPGLLAETGQPPAAGNAAEASDAAEELDGGRNLQEPKKTIRVPELFRAPPEDAVEATVAPAPIPPENQGSRTSPSALPAVWGLLSPQATVDPEDGDQGENAKPRLSKLLGYELQRELGRGGMGIVYQATDTRLKRVVALKVLPPAFAANPVLRQRFRIEAEAVARLQHPNIVQLYDAGDVDGQPFFSLEYVGGGSLAQQPLPVEPRCAALWMEIIARAIAFAHQRGVLHRDLKPANILMSEDGTLKVTDFGLAKNLANTSGLTHTGDVMGTPSYMAPEQATGRVHQLGPASDVYSLGAILYELLTGQPPFRANSPAETIHQVLTKEASFPSEPKGLPRDLMTICLKCLEKEPRRRYASATVLADDLGRFSRHEPVSARPVGTGGRVWRWARRRPAVAGLLSALVMVFLLGLPVMTVLYLRERDAVASALLKQREANSLRVAAQMLTARGWSEDAVRLMNEGKLAEAFFHNQRAWEWETRWGDPEQAKTRAALYRYRAATMLGQYPRLKADYSPKVEAVSKFWGTPQGQTLVVEGLLSSVACDPRSGEQIHPQLPPSVPPVREATRVFFSDGKHFCVAFDDERVELWQHEPLRRIRSMELPPKLKLGGERRWVLAADRWLYQIHGSDIFHREWHGVTWDTTTGKLVTPRWCPLQIQGVSRIGWMTTQNGNLVWFTQGGNIKMFSPHLVETHAFQIGGDQTCAVEHPTKPLLLVANAASQIRCWNYQTGQEQPIALPRLGNLILHMAMDALGKFLLVSLADGTVSVMNLQNGQTQNYSGHQGAVQWGGFSPDGHWFVTGGADGVVLIRGREDGALAFPPIVHPFGVTRVAFLPDGRHLLCFLYTPNRFCLWDLMGSELNGPLLMHDGPVIDLSFHPDGKKLLSASEDGTARLWDTRTGQMTCPPLLHYAPVQGCDWIGERVVTLSARAARFWDGTTGQARQRPLGAALVNGLGVSAIKGQPRGNRAVLHYAEGAHNVFDTAAQMDIAQFRFDWGFSQFSPDGRWFVKTRELNGALYGVSPWKVLLSGKWWKFEFHPDSTKAIAIHENLLEWIDLHSMKVVVKKTVDGPRLQRIGWSVDGKRFFTLDEQGTCRVWDAATVAMVGEPFPLRANPLWLGFVARPDRTELLATVESNGEARLWDWRLGELAAPPFRHGGGLRTVAVRADGRQLALGDGRQAIRLWTIPGIPKGMMPDAAAARAWASLLFARQPGNKNRHETLDIQSWGLLARQLFADERAPRWPILDEAEWETKRANAGERAGDFSATIFHLQRLLPLQDKQCQLKTLHHLARVQEENNQPSAALETWNRVLEAVPDEPQARAARMRLLARSEQWEAAFGEASSLAARFPHQPQYQLWRHVLAARLDRTEEARAALKKAAEQMEYFGWLPLDPRLLHQRRAESQALSRFVANHLQKQARLEVFRTRAWIGLLGHDHDQAKADFGAYSANNPQDPWDVYGLALLAWRAGNFQEAMKHLDAAIAAAPQEGCFLAARAWLHLRQQKWDDASRDATGAEGLGFRGPVFDPLSVFLNFTRGDPIAARAALERTRPAQDFFDPLTWEKLALRLGEIGHHEAAADILQYTLKPGSARAETLLQYVVSARLAGRKVSAEELEPFFPTDLAPEGIALNAWIWLATFTHSTPSALDTWVELLAKLLDDDSAPPEMKNTLAAALYRRHRFSEARRCLEQIVTTPKVTGWDWVYLALARIQMGDHASARVALANAEKWVETETRPGARFDSWLARGELRLLLDEARGLLK